MTMIAGRCLAIGRAATCAAAYIALLLLCVSAVSPLFVYLLFLTTFNYILFLLVFTLKNPCIVSIFIFYFDEVFLLLLNNKEHNRYKHTHRQCT